MSKKSILIDDSMGRLAMDMERTTMRLQRGGGYRDLSTVCVMANRNEYIHLRVMTSWWNMMTPMNQKFYRLPVLRMEIGEAYNQSFQQIMEHPELGKFQYILTLESDNMPPADGLIKMYDNMDRVDVVSGLYFTKGEMGQPMIYGEPGSVPMNFWPQIPLPDRLQLCNGLGMGFTLFKTEIFRNPALTKPWFKTLQEEIPGKGLGAYTQDLYFFEKIASLGYKVGCDTRIKVGHYDEREDVVW